MEIMKPTQEQIEAAAEAIANARVNRRGAPSIKGVLKILPDKLRTEVLEDAKSALEAVQVDETPSKEEAIDPFSALQAVARQMREALGMPDALVPDDAKIKLERRRKIKDAIAAYDKLEGTMTSDPSLNPPSPTPNTTCHE